MIKRFTIFCVLVCFVAPTAISRADDGELRNKLRAWKEWYQSRGVTEAEGDNVTAIETAALSINQAIAADAGGGSDRYLDYSRRLALTLNEKSTVELKRVFDSNNTLGLGG